MTYIPSMTGLPYNYMTHPAYMAYVQQLAQQQQQMQEYYANLRQEQLAQQQAQEQAAMQNMAQGATDTYAPQTVQQEQPLEAQSPNGCTDGADDGHLGFGEAVSNVGKGVVNFFKNMVCDEEGFSLSRTLKTAAVAAGGVALTVATGGAALPYLVAAGATMGAVETGKGVYKAATAKTDAEAKLAYQSIGSGGMALVASVAGAKSAVKAAGGTVAENSGIMGSLKATGDCLKIAGSGLAKGGKAAIFHPMQSARSISSYFNNTMKPNFAKAFSWQTAHDNYVKAMEENLNKNLKTANDKLAVLRDELAAHPEKAAELNPQIQDLEAQTRILYDRIGSNNFAKAYAEGKDNLTQLQKDPAFSEAKRLKFGEIKDMANSQLKKAINAETRNRLEAINKVKEQIKTATGDTKTALEQKLKFMEAQHKALSAQAKVEIAQYNVENANSQIARLQNALKDTSLTEAQKTNINTRIAKLEKAIAGDKQVLRNQNMIITTKQTLPKSGVPTAAAYLAYENSQSGAAREAYLAQLQAYNEAVAQQQAALEAQRQQELAQAQAQAEAQNQQAATMPYTNPYAMTNPYAQQVPPMGTGLDFNSLYVSPYPDMM